MNVVDSSSKSPPARLIPGEDTYSEGARNDLFGTIML